MSENLSNFLADLGSDGELLSRVMTSPEAELARAGLTTEEQTAILSRDPREVARALSLSPKKAGIHKTTGIHKKKRPGTKRTPPAPKKKKR